LTLTDCAVRGAESPIMRSIVRTTHKYLSLSLGVLWLLQALTGVLISFQGEIGDALLPGANRALAPGPFGAAIAKLIAARPQATLSYIMASEGSPNRYDVLFTDKDDHTRSVRVDGEGTVLRDVPRDYDYPAPGLFQTAHDFHETLFAGDRGKWFLGLSGFVLLSNLLFGLTLAWPARGQRWRRVLLPGTSGPPAAKFYKWHRALGPCLLVPAIVIVACGVLQQWPVDRWLGVESVAPQPRATAQTGLVTLADALTTALQRYPGAVLSLVEMPGADQPWYRIRLRQPGELRRVFGQTTLFVDAHDGAVLLDRDAFKLPLNEKIANAFYPIHNGEFLGLAGRVVSLITGLGLLTMAALGAGMWWTRRNARGTTKRTQPATTVP
jgi:uncharacterized iron-regulated membrane protein